MHQRVPTIGLDYISHILPDPTSDCWLQERKKAFDPASRFFGASGVPNSDFGNRIC